LVPETYSKRLRLFIRVTATVLALAVTWRYWLPVVSNNAKPLLPYWWTFALIIFTVSVFVFLVGLFGSMFAKRKFPPTLEDCEEYSKQAHYTAP